MEQFDIAFRAAAIAVIAVFIVITVKSNTQLVRRLIAAAFLVSIAAYLLCSASFIEYAPRGFYEAVHLVCPLPPALFYTWSRTLFDDRFRLHWQDGAFAALLLGLYGLSRLAGADDSMWLMARSLAGLVMVVAALVKIGAGLRLDLVEPRRRLRAIILLVTGIYVAAVVAFEIFLKFERPQPVVEMMNAAGVLLVVMVLTSAASGLNPGLYGPRPASSAAKGGRLEAREQKLLDDLNRFLQEEGYRDEGLTISSVAGRLGAQDYRLRRLINGQLGFRNFNDFLNTYRVEAAKADFRDPEKADLPILTIAMDLGYRSLASFNRAFKEITGMTPSEYRRVAEPTDQSSKT